MLRLGVLLLSSAVAMAGCGREGETESQGAGAQGARAQGPIEASLPGLKPGRWRTTTHVEGSDQHPPPTSACITDQTQKANVAMAERLGSLSCSERWVRRDGDAIVSHAVCQVDGVTQTFDTRATGDFSADFFIDSVVKRDPPLDGQAEYRTKIHSRWMGDC